jgi:solute carrier family 19 (thiamine transporter), member 2/3
VWQQIDPDTENLYNGAVEGALTLLGALSALAAGYIRTELLEKFDLWLLTAIAMIQGVLVIILSQTFSIWVAYSMYIIFGTLYMFMITLVR